MTLKNRTHIKCLLLQPTHYLPQAYLSHFSIVLLSSSRPSPDKMCIRDSCIANREGDATVSDRPAGGT